MSYVWNLDKSISSVKEFDETYKHKESIHHIVYLLTIKYYFYSYIISAQLSIIKILVLVEICLIKLNRLHFWWNITDNYILNFYEFIRVLGYLFLSLKWKNEVYLIWQYIFEIFRFYYIQISINFSCTSFI